MSDIDPTKIRQVDGGLLLVLQLLIRHRRTTVVADQLGLSQSAISHALTRLRALFGDPLFVRRPHGLEPTRHALELAPRIDALIRATQEAIGLPDGFDPKTTTRGFRLGAPDFLTTLLAPSLLEAFERQAPNARFAFKVLLGAEAIDQLRRHEIDLAVGRFQARLDGFQVEPLFEDHYCLVARQDHPAIGGDVSRRQFEDLSHVATSASGDFRSFTDDDFRDLELTRQVVATAPRFLTAFAMVAATDAVAIAPRRLAMAYAQTFRLSVHALPFALPPISVAAVRRPGPDRAADWLLDQLRPLARTD